MDNTVFNRNMFLSELKTVTFESASDGPVSFRILKGGVEVFGNTYYPYGGQVTVCDVDRLCDNCIDDIFTDLTIVTGTVSRTVRVFRNRVDIDGPGEEFLESHFLTPVMVQRDTCPGRFETLAAYSDTPVPAIAHCAYFSSGKLASRDFSLGDVEGLTVLDVSPGQFVTADAGTLVGVTVECGLRRATFRVMASMPEADPSLLYRNCFDIWETIYLTGTKEKDAKYERSTTMVRGRLRLYDVDEKVQFTAHTGIMRRGTEIMAYDLARSRSVFFLLDNGVAGDELVVLDAKVAYDNNDDTLPDFTFTYRRADRYTDKLSSGRPPRIFDGSFDPTFN